MAPASLTGRHQNRFHLDRSRGNTLIAPTGTESPAAQVAAAIHSKRQLAAAEDCKGDPLLADLGDIPAVFHDHHRVDL